jgi:hypothetical protein
MSLRSSTSARRKTKKARLRNWDASRGRPFEGDVPAGIRSTMRVCVARATNYIRSSTPSIIGMQLPPI